MKRKYSKGKSSLGEGEGLRGVRWGKGFEVFCGEGRNSRSRQGVANRPRASIYSFSRKRPAVHLGGEVTVIRAARSGDVKKGGKGG